MEKKTIYFLVLLLLVVTMLAIMRWGFSGRNMKALLALEWVLFVVVVGIKNVEGLYWIAFFTAYVGMFFSNYLHFLPLQFRWTFDLAVLLMFILIKPMKVWQRSPALVNMAVILFLISCALSSLVQGGTVLGIITGWRRILLPILLYYSLLSITMRRGFFAKFVKYFLIIAMIQPAIAFLEFFLWTPGMMNYISPEGGADRIDIAAGTLGASGTGVLSQLMLMAVCLMVTSHTLGRRIRRFYIKIPYLLSPFAVTFSGGAILNSVAVFFSLAFGTGRRKVAQNIIKILLLFIVLWIMLEGASKVSAWVLGSERRMITYVLNAVSSFDTVGAGRGSVFLFVLDELRGVPNGFLLGAGPGNFSRSKFGDYTSALLSRSISLGINPTNVGELGSMTAELGLAGLILTRLLLIFILIQSFSLKLEKLNSQGRLCVMAFRSVWVVFFLGTFYTGGWTTYSLMLPFFTLAAATMTVELWAKRTSEIGRTRNGKDTLLVSQSHSRFVANP